MASRSPVSEDDFRRHVIDLLGKDGCHLSHIESHLTSAGIPDINFYKSGRDVWLELKVAKDGKVKMRPTQKRWHKDRAARGGQSWVLVLSPSKDRVLWLPGAVAAGLEPSWLAWVGAAGEQNILPLGSIQVFFNHITYGDFS